jgi:hypothetical protein
MHEVVVVLLAKRCSDVVCVVVCSVYEFFCPEART